MGSTTLLVHCYELKRTSEGSVTIGDLAAAVCRKVARIHSRYKHIVLLGGYDLLDGKPHPCPKLTLASKMRCRLQELGVPPKKIFDHLSDSEMDERILPRDTAEETDLAGLLLYNLNFFDERYDAICVWYFVPRVRFLYWFRRLRPRKVIPAWGLRTIKPKRMFTAGIVALVVYALNPYGSSGKPFGDRIAEHRRLRTPRGCSSMKPPQPYYS